METVPVKGMVADGGPVEERIQVLRLAVEQAGRVLEFQMTLLAEQGAQNERAARFATGLMVIAVAVVGLMVTVGWGGSSWALAAVMLAFALFFAQGSWAAIRLHLLAASPTSVGYLNPGPAPEALLQGALQGPWSMEAWLIRVLRQSAQSARVNGERLVQTARARGRWVTVNLGSIAWLAAGVAIYVAGGIWAW